MLQYFNIKALMLGIITGLICTVFDGIFILGYKSYVPYSYPFILLIFNTVFWGIVGVIETFCYSLFMKGKHSQKNEALYGVFFYLIPFVALYGGLGRFPVPHATFATLMERSTNPVFDHHLSFVWVALILMFLICYFKKTGAIESFSPLAFSIEIVTFVLLFQFCSNPHPYLKAFNHVARYLNASPALSVVSLYILGVSGILGI